MFIRDVRSCVVENTVECVLQFLHITLVLIDLGLPMLAVLLLIQHMQLTQLVMPGTLVHNAVCTLVSPQLHALDVVYSDTHHQTTASSALVVGKHS